MRDERDQERYLPWHFYSVETIIKSGKHPTDKALVCALRGSEKISRTVRDYLADRIEKGRPRRGCTKTVWEIEDNPLLDRKNLACLEVEGVLNRSWQHFIFFGKVGCSDETKTSNIFYSRAEARDMGSLETWRVHEFDRTWV